MFNKKSEDNELQNGMCPPKNYHHRVSIPVERPAANAEFTARRRKWLSENPAALAYLNSRGIGEKIRRSFHLGLSEINVNKNKNPYGKALVAPVIGAEGFAINKSVYFNIPSITIKPNHETSWVKGDDPLTYYGEALRRQKTVFVCPTLPELWRIWGALGEMRRKLNLLLIASTHENQIPRQWLEPTYWERFEAIYLGYQNNDGGIENKFAQKISAGAGHEIRRVIIPSEKGNNWCDFWQNGGTPAEFETLLLQAHVEGVEIIEPKKESFGHYSYQPVDILNEYHNGHLYYAVRAHSKMPVEASAQSAAGTKVVERTETVIVKSDRTVHFVCRAPAPKGTPPDERILRLSDGTVIESAPRASKYATWSWESIQAYLRGTSKPRSLSVLLRNIRAFLKLSVWLPDEHDYELLSLVAAVTFSQTIFQSVPLILVTGAPGSGKSALGRAMTQVCANASILGQASAASIIRHVHETKGFVVLDDLESIGRQPRRQKAGSSAGGGLFNELVQFIKLSYNKETSRKSWTDMSRSGKTECLNFYGVKMINNTRGADYILGSRTLRVQTRQIPTELQTFRQEDKLWSTSLLNQYRDELHTWTFENAALIAQKYKAVFPYVADRSAEITAPLRVMAEISGDEEFIKGLEAALAAKTRLSSTGTDPVEVIKEAAKNLVRAGYRQIAVSHLVLEIKALLSEFGAASSSSIKLDDPAWVGRQLRAIGIVATAAAPERQRLLGRSLRIYPVAESFMHELIPDDERVLGTEKKVRGSLDFCRGCADCRYRQLWCPFMERRLKIDRGRSVADH